MDVGLMIEKDEHWEWWVGRKEWMGEDSEEWMFWALVMTVRKGKTVRKRKDACLWSLAARLDAVAGLPRQARGSRLRAHGEYKDLTYGCLFTEASTELHGVKFECYSSYYFTIYNAITDVEG
jgi:hypothetical protein